MVEPWFVKRSSIPQAALGDGEIALLNPQRGNYHGLSGVGVAIWQLLETPHTLPMVCQKLTAEFSVTDEACMNDTREFIEALLREDLIEIHYEQAHEVPKA